MPDSIPPKVFVLAFALTMLSGCATLGALDDAARPLDTYELSPVPGTTGGGRSARILIVAAPETSAALSTDRILIKPDPLSVTYLPEARWSDELEPLIQSLLIRSISATRRIAYVGSAEAGPVPDRALLVRIDAFQIDFDEQGSPVATIDLVLTMINDRDQRIIGSQVFTKAARAPSDGAPDVVATFQTLLDDLLPAMADWAVGRL